MKHTKDPLPALLIAQSIAGTNQISPEKERPEARKDHLIAVLAAPSETQIQLDLKCVEVNPMSSLAVKQNF